MNGFSSFRILLLILSILMAAAHEFAIFRKCRGWLLPTKVVMMLSLLAWALVSTPLATAWSNPAGRGLFWFLGGLLFCLVGDILLELPPEKWFRPGLFAFLMGQVGYVVGFGSFFPAGAGFFFPLATALMILAFDFWILPKLFLGLQQSSNTKMRIPVLIYAVCISLMLYCASIRLVDERWLWGHGLLVAVGALSFFVSDILNAWSRFIGVFPNHRQVIMSTYHLAQLLINTGVVLHFSRLFAG